MKYYYEEKFLIFKLRGKLHKKAVMYNVNYKNHIKINHPEMTMNKIEKILNDPDYIYKPSRNSSVFYYEKNWGKDTFRVVVEKYKKNVKIVITAYKIENKDKFTIKHAYCVYNKETYTDYRDTWKQLENDVDYFYELFSGVK
ncbi:hypothetical protein [Clostridium tyrobutyricum]|uniref:hypothetical protein n=1 Tax=Clostridium tyrobutyricum TaxID=1519 RepID=UPI001C3CDC9B|nr:hypothetical protein [Clostridium tyrobutyricum]MBV4436329.1 hypothetical protein [Clostridium tyrobutyricum]